MCGIGAYRGWRALVDNALRREKKSEASRGQRPVAPDRAVPARRGVSYIISPLLSPVASYNSVVVPDSTKAWAKSMGHNNKQYPRKVVQHRRVVDRMLNT